MRDGVDSLSVVVACGILFHGLDEREEAQQVAVIRKNNSTLLVSILIEKDAGG